MNNIKKTSRYYTLHDTFNMELLPEDGAHYMKFMWMPIDYGTFPIVDGTEIKSISVYVNVIHRLLCETERHTINV